MAGIEKSGYSEDPLGIAEFSTEDVDTREFYISEEARAKAIPDAIVYSLEEQAAILEFSHDESPKKIVKKLQRTGGAFSDDGEFMPLEGTFLLIKAACRGNEHALGALSEENCLQEAVANVLESERKTQKLLSLVETAEEKYKKQQTDSVAIQEVNGEKPNRISQWVRERLA